MEFAPHELHGSVIEAAGGVLERSTADGPRIAVIYRDRYGPEWALPKGKRKPEDSTWEYSAFREVLEETGIKATPLSVAGCTSYLAGSKPKMVVYWRMRPDQEPHDFTPNEEVKELRWLSPAEAIELLTHEEEKRVLRTLFPTRVGASTRSKLLQNMARRYRLLALAKPLDRLRTSLAAYRIDLEGRARRSTALSRNLPPLQAGLAAAARAADDGHLEEGWKSLLAVQRLELLFADEEDLQAAALAIRHEAAKLNPWRKAAVLDLLEAGKGASAKSEYVFKAAALRDEHYHNEAYKDALSVRMPSVLPRRSFS